MQTGERETEAVEETEEVVETVQEVPADETVEQSVERAISELSQKPEKAEAPQEEPAAAQAAQAVPQVEAVEAPAQLNDEQKAVFSKLPPELKKAARKMFDGQQDYFRQITTKAQQAIKESYGIAEVIKPKLAEWKLQDYSPVDAVQHLVAAHEYLLTKPKEGLVWLANERGVSLRELADLQEGKAAQPGQAPVNNELQEKVNTIYNELQQAKAAQFEQAASGIVAELRAVKEEKGPSGYLYPEMHQPGFFERVKPLVTSIREASGCSWGDALKKAYFTVTGKFPNQIQPKVPVSPTEISSAKNAGLSVRGRNGTPAPIRMPDRIPNSIEETVRLAHEMLSRGS